MVGQADAVIQYGAGFGGQSGFAHHLLNERNEELGFQCQRVLIVIRLVHIHSVEIRNAAAGNVYHRAVHAVRKPDVLALRVNNEDIHIVPVFEPEKAPF